MPSSTLTPDPPTRCRPAHPAPAHPPAPPPPPPPPCRSGSAHPARAMPLPASPPRPQPHPPGCAPSPSPARRATLRLRDPRSRVPGRARAARPTRTELPRASTGGSRRHRPSPEPSHLQPQLHPPAAPANALAPDAGLATALPLQFAQVIVEILAGSLAEADHRLHDRPRPGPDRRSHPAGRLGPATQNPADPNVAARGSGGGDHCSRHLRSPIARAGHALRAHARASARARLADPAGPMALHRNDTG